MYQILQKKLGRRAMAEECASNLSLLEPPEGLPTLAGRIFLTIHQPLGGHLQIPHQKGFPKASSTEGLDNFVTVNYSGILSFENAIYFPSSPSPFSPREKESRKPLWFIDLKSLSLRERDLG
jgi:hypothetical protein